MPLLAVSDAENTSSNSSSVSDKSGSIHIKMKANPLSRDELWIVVVGRNNIAQSSRSLEQMTRDLCASGFAVHYFESRQAQRAHRMNDWFDGFLSGSVAEFCGQYAWCGRWLQKMIKGIWLLAHPSCWDFSRLKGVTYNDRNARDLKKLLCDWRCHWPSRRVSLFSHSAGGIASSWLEAEANVVSLVCFGYPFRHPQMPEQSYRTAHLQSMRKPFLIIQGNQDVYGSAEQARQYSLSESIRMEAIQADHNYDDFSSELYTYCLELVENFYRDAVK